MKHTITTAVVGTMLGLILAGPAVAQKAPIQEEKPGLLAKARVSPDAARKTAQERVKGGKLQKEEIEEEDGKLLYSFEFTVAGKPGVEEVNVDAQTGKVASVEHETRAKERSETAREKSEK